MKFGLFCGGNQNRHKHKHKHILTHILVHTYIHIYNRSLLSPRKRLDTVLGYKIPENHFSICKINFVFLNNIIYKDYHNFTKIQYISLHTCLYEQAVG